MRSIPEISVVMSVYNGEKYLDEAIESILNQTYTNFEFIIINDGSKDRSLEIIEYYKNKDERIVIISRENKGLIVSLNEGIEKAKGKYIARMDADDICFSTRFEEQLKYMKENKLDLCGSWVQPFDKKIVHNLWTYPEHHSDIVFRSFFISSFAHPSVMIKKNIFSKLKYENEVAEDYKLWCDIMLSGAIVGNIQKVLLKYRLHENQITLTKSKELRESSNNISLQFARKLKNKVVPLVKEIQEIQEYNSTEKFKKILIKFLKFTKKYNIKDSNTIYIIKRIYTNASPKNPMIYLAYTNVTKNYEKDLKEEFILFVKSFIFVGGESSFYQFLKILKKMMKV